MIWALQLLISLWFGYALVSYLVKNRFNHLIRIAAGIPIGFFFFSWLVFIFSFKRVLTEKISYIPMFLTIVLSTYLTKKVREMHLSPYVKLGLVEFTTLVSFGFFFVLLMYKSMLYKGRESKGAGYGDIPFHLNIVSGFSNGCNIKRDSFFKVDTVFYAGEKLAYPYMTNYLTAVYMATGNATMRAALLWPSSFMILSLLFGIYYLGYEFHQSHFSCLLSLFFFCNLGGLGWIMLFYPGKGTTDMIHNWGNDQYEYWFHPIMHVLIPQRASLWSMPLCYWTLMCLIYGIRTKEWEFFALAGIYTGITPLVQAHSFVGMAQWAVIYAILTFPWKRKEYWVEYIKLWAIFGVVANALALPQFIPYMNRVKTKNDEFVAFNPIWSKHNTGKKIYTPIVMWWRGLGVFGAVALVFGWATLSKEQIILYLPSIIVFVITNFIRYQPWELDNTKVFYAAWIPLALPVVGQFFAKLFKRPTTSIIALLLIFAGTASALRHFINAFSTKSDMFESDAVVFGDWISENTPIKSIFLTSNWHAHPVLTLAGRQGFMGYGGWVLSHGLDYWGRSASINDMTKNPDKITKFNNNNITYVVSRRKEFPIFEKIEVNDLWTLIYSNNDYKVWKRVV